MNQTQIEEDVTSDDELTVVESGIESAKSEFLRPEYSFKGIDLFPFTYGYELLFNQVRDPEDTGLFTWLAFIFLLRKRHSGDIPSDHRKWAIGLCWRVADFREAIISWMDETGPFSQEDKLEAKRIYEESMKAAISTAVEVAPSRSARVSQKKTHRQKKP